MATKIKKHEDSAAKSAITNKGQAVKSAPHGNAATASMPEWQKPYAQYFQGSSQRSTATQTTPDWMKPYTKYMTGSQGAGGTQAAPQRTGVTGIAQRGARRMQAVAPVVQAARHQSYYGKTPEELEQEIQRLQGMGATTTRKLDPEADRMEINRRAGELQQELVRADNQWRSDRYDPLLTQEQKDASKAQYDAAVKAFDDFRLNPSVEENRYQSDIDWIRSYIDSGDAAYNANARKYNADLDSMKPQEVLNWMDDPARTDEEREWARQYILDYTTRHGMFGEEDYRNVAQSQGAYERLMGQQGANAPLMEAMLTARYATEDEDEYSAKRADKEFRAAAESYAEAMGYMPEEYDPETWWDNHSESYASARNHAIGRAMLEAEGILGESHAYLDWQRSQQERLQNRQYADEHPALATLQSYATAPLGNIVGGAYLKGAKILGYTPSSSSRMLKAYNATRDVRNEVSGNIIQSALESGLSEKDARFLNSVYGVVNSAVDSSINMMMMRGAVGALGNAADLPVLNNAVGDAFNIETVGNVVGQLVSAEVMGNGAMLDAFEDYTNKGYSNDKALAAAIAAGGIEAFTEAIGGERTMEAIIRGDRTLNDVLVQFGAEGLEEWYGNVLNDLFADMYLGDSEAQQRIRDRAMVLSLGYLNAYPDMKPSEAFKKALTETVLEEDATAFLQGGFSALISTGAGRAVRAGNTAVNDYSSGRQMIREGYNNAANIATINREAAELGVDAPTISESSRAYDLGRTARLTTEARAGAQAQQAVTEAAAAIEAELSRIGYEGDAHALAEAMAKQQVMSQLRGPVSQETLEEITPSDEERRLLRQRYNRQAAQIVQRGIGGSLGERTAGTISANRPTYLNREDAAGLQEGQDARDYVQGKRVAIMAAYAAEDTEEAVKIAEKYAPDSMSREQLQAIVERTAPDVAKARVDENGSLKLPESASSAAVASLKGIYSRIDSADQDARDSFALNGLGAYNLGRIYGGSEYAASVLQGKLDAHPEIRDQLQAAFDAGLRERTAGGGNVAQAIPAATTESRQKKRSGLISQEELEAYAATGDNGIATMYAVDAKALKPKQKKMVQMARRLSRALNVGIVFYDSRDASGNVARDADGNLMGANGFYHNGNVYLDINSGLDNGGSVTFTLAHELTHVMARRAGTEFKALENFVVDYFYKNKGGSKGYDQALQEIMGSDSSIRTEDDAREELVARSCEDMLTNTQAIRALYEKDKTLFGKVSRAVDRFVRAFNDAVKWIQGESKAGNRYAAALRESQEAMAELQKLWDAALVETAMREETTLQDAMQDAAEIGASAQMAEEAIVRNSSKLSQETIDFLENQEHVTVYRAMQVIDGKLYPPMAARVASEKGQKRELVDPTEFGQWYQAVERPDLIDPKTGKWKLDKANGASVDAAYNPYFHSSASPLNDQFTSAWERPNLVVVEGIIPKSELSSGYRAQYAKDPVGETKWHSGVVSSKLKGAKARRVFLSRWFQAQRIVPDAEVAGMIAETLEGETVKIPVNVVTPSLLAELRKQGVAIDETPRGLKEKNAAQGGVKLSVKARDAEHLAAVERGDMRYAGVLVREAAQEAGYTVEGYHGTRNFGFTVIDTGMSDDQLSFFVTNDLNTARTYSTRANVREINDSKQPSDEDYWDHLDALYDEAQSAGIDLATEMSDMAGIQGWVYAEDINKRLAKIAEQAQQGFDIEQVREALQTYLDDLTWDLFDTVNGNKDGTSDEYDIWIDSDEAKHLRDYIDNTIAAYGSYAEAQIEEDTDAGNYHVFIDPTGLLTIDCKGKKWNNIDGSGPLPETNGGRYWTTRSVSKWAKEHNYTGVLFRNVIDDGGRGGRRVMAPADVYALFNPQEQVKSADPVTYDDKGKVIPLSERFNRENEDIRFSMKAPVEETDRFIALHNMNEEALRGALEIGGMAMPSIALVRADSGHDTYGDISAVFGKDSVNPTDRRNRIFSGDAYTPTFPEIGYKISEKASRDATKRVEDLLREAGVPERTYSPALDTDNAADMIKRWGSFERAYRDRDELKIAFLQDTGRGVKIPMMEKVYTSMADLDTLRKIAQALPIQEAYNQGYQAVKELEPEIRKFVHDYAEKRFEKLGMADKLYPMDQALPYNKVDQVIHAALDLMHGGETTQVDRKTLDQRIEDAMSKEGVREAYASWLQDLGKDFVEKRGIRNDKDLFTPSGNRRSFEQLYYDYSLANIVKAMQSEVQQGKTSFLTGSGNIRGAAAKSYGSIEEARQEIGRIRNMGLDETKDEAYKAFDQRCMELCQRMVEGKGHNKYLGAIDAAEVLTETLAKHKTEDAIYRYLSRNYSGYYNTTRDIAHDAAELVKEAQQLPVSYLEAKLYRAVTMDEPLAYVVPESTDPKLVQDMRNQGLNVITYRDGDNADRLAKVNSIEGAKFSKKQQADPLDTDAQIQDLRETTARLQRLLNREGKATAEWRAAAQKALAPRLWEADAESLAKTLRRETGSTMEAEEITAAIRQLGRLAMDENGDLDALFASAEELAESLVDSAEGDIGGDQETYDALRNYFKGQRIYFPRTMRGDLTPDAWNDYRRSFPSFVNIVASSDNATPIDTIYQELQGMYGSLFPDTIINQADQLARIKEVLDRSRSRRGNPFQGPDRGYFIQAYTAKIMQAVDDTITRRLESIGTPTKAQRAGAKLDEQSLRDRATIREQGETIREQEGAIARAETANATQRRTIRELSEEVSDLRAMLKKNRENNENAIRELKQAQRDRERGIRRDLREEMQKRERAALERGRQRLREYRINRDQGDAVKKLRSRIEGNVKELLQLVTENSDKRHVPDQLREPLADFLNAINLESNQLAGGGPETRRDEQWARKFERLNTAIQQQRAAEAEGTAPDSLYLPDDFYNLMDQAAQAVRSLTEAYGGQESIYSMDGDALRSLDTALKILKHTVKSANQAMVNSYAEKISDIAEGTIRHLDKLGAAGVSKGIPGWLNNLIFWQNGTPYYVFKRFGDAGFSVFQSIMDGQGKLAAISEKIINDSKEMFTPAQVKEWESEVHDVTLSDGRTVKMTTAQIMSFHALAKRQQAVGHLLGGGMKIDAFRQGRQTIDDRTDYVLGVQDIAAIDALLTEEQRRVADAMQRYMSSYGSELGNEVTMRRFGYKAYGESNYFTIQSDRQNLDGTKEEEQRASLLRLLNMSHTKALVDNANNALVVRSIFDVFSEHMSDMAEYNALALPVLDMVRWFNYKRRESGDLSNFETVSTQKSLATAFGGYDKTGKAQNIQSLANSYVKTFLKDLNGNNERGRDIGLGNLMSKYKRASVAANLRVAIQQPMSIMRAGAVIDYKWLAKGVAMTPEQRRQAAEELQTYSNEAKWKGLGYHDIYIGRSVASQIKQDQSTVDKLVDRSMLLAEKGDEITWAALWQACKLEQQSKGASGGDLMAATARRFQTVIYSTQVMDATTTRSQSMRSNDALNQMWTAFMAEPTLSTNLLMDSFMQYRLAARSGGDTTEARKQAFKATYKTAMRAVTAYAFNAIAVALAESLIDAFRDDDDYETFIEKYLEALGDNWLDELNPLSKVTVLKDLINTFTSKYGAGDRMDVAAFSNAKKSIDILTEMYKVNVLGEDPTQTTYYGKMTWYGATYQLLKTASQLTGLPFAGLSREAQTLWNNLIYPGARAAGAEVRRLKTYNESAKTVGYPKLYEAITSGDEREAMKLREEMYYNGISDEAVTKGLKEQIKSHYIDGDLDEEMAAELLAEYCGADPAATGGKSIQYTLDTWLYGSDFKMSGDLNDALQSGNANDIKAAVQNQRVRYRRADKDIKSDITSFLKPLLLAGDVTRDFCLRALKATGLYSDDEAKKAVERWLK